MLRFLEILFQSGEVYRRAGPKGCVIAIVAVVVILAILAALIAPVLAGPMTARAASPMQVQALTGSALEQALDDETWFAYVCHLDPCEACYAEGYRQPKDGCKHCDNWTDPKVWPKTNPALHDLGLPRLDYLQSQVDTALSMPTRTSRIAQRYDIRWV